MPNTFAPFAYFSEGEPLAEVGERGEDEIVDYGYDDQRAFVLRVISAIPPTQVFGRVALQEALSASNVGGLDRDSGGFFRVNKFGAIAFDILSNSKGQLANSTQVFQNGEIWGINREYISETNSDTPYVPSVAIEQAYRRALPTYLDFAQKRLALRYPFKVIRGAVGLTGVQLAVRNNYGRDRIPSLIDGFAFSETLSSEDQQTTFLVKLFQEMWDGCRLRRPAQIDGFPGTSPSPSASPLSARR